MKFLQIAHYYPEYLNIFYKKFENKIKQNSYEENIKLLINDYFNAVHNIAPYMRNLGYESMFVVANFFPIQMQWLNENGLKLKTKNWMYEITIKQIEKFKPDILYLSHPIGFDANFLRCLSYKPNLVMGWRAAEFPANIDWSGFDLMLSGLEPLLKLAKERGVKNTEIFMPGFPKEIFEELKYIKPKYDIVFSGQFTKHQHRKRGFYLKQIAKLAIKKDYSCRFFLSGEINAFPEEIKKFLEKPVYGKEMLKSLRLGKILFDIRANHFIFDGKRKIDIGKSYTANMRLFEATGVGAFLITEYFDNLKDYFVLGEEIETFKNTEELLEKINYFIEHPEDRERIARKGQKRCLNDHSMEKRAEWLDNIIKKYISKRTSKNRYENVPLFISNSIEEAIMKLEKYIHKFPRRKRGSIVIKGKEYFFADLHSFYHELKQIFVDNIYNFSSDEKAPIIIDCGAHIGLSSIYFSTKYKSAKIYAFEADPEIFEIFQKNISSLNLNNIETYNKAVWIHDKGVYFTQEGDDSGHVSSKGIFIPSISLKNFIKNFKKVEFLKLDIEGAEFEVIKDCDKILKKVENLIIEVHCFEDKKISDIFSVLEKNNFKYVISDFHLALWEKISEKPPFKFTSHDKYIFTIFAWKKKKRKLKKDKIKVAHFCVQDFGGAGIAAYRLHKGLIEKGVDSRLFVLNSNKIENSIEIVSKFKNFRINAKFIAPEWNEFNKLNFEILKEYPNKVHWLEAFNLPVSFININDYLNPEDFDIINFHWIPGIINFQQEYKIFKNKKIVWTMHDMNPFTGGCHYSNNCEKFKDKCGSCPLLGSISYNDISRMIWEVKKRTYDLWDMTIVSPSNWLANCARQSSLLASFDIHVIPNGINTEIFKPISNDDKRELRKLYNIKEEKFVVLFGADSILNKRKGIIYLLSALKILSDYRIENIHLAIFGGNINEIKELNYPFTCFNYIEKEGNISLIYNLADVTIISSLEDNLPNIVIESLACGTPVVGFDVGGIPDMIKHKVNGYLAKKENVEDLAKGIMWILTEKLNGRDFTKICRKDAISRFDYNLQAERYLRLYKKILKK